MNAIESTAYEAMNINAGNGRRMWVFGRKHHLATGGYSPASGRYATYEEAMDAARDYYDDPYLTESERAKLI